MRERKREKREGRKVKGGGEERMKGREMGIKKKQRHEDTEKIKWEREKMGIGTHLLPPSRFRNSGIMAPAGIKPNGSCAISCKMKASEIPLSYISFRIWVWCRFSNLYLI